MERAKWIGTLAVALVFLGAAVCLAETGPRRMTLPTENIAKETYLIGEPGQFTLLIDIKTGAIETYKVLDRILAEYQDIFTSFGQDGRSDKAVLAIISGNRPREFMESQKIRYAGCDGRLTDLESEHSADLIPMISDNWRNHFKWNGTGEMPAEERDKLREIVQKAHEKGRLVRLWSTPDNPSPAREALWRELLSAGVDRINTDDLEGLRQFLLANRSR